jgi:GH24 family phage-related lysozyme (muramidase)
LINNQRISLQPPALALHQTKKVRSFLYQQGQYGTPAKTLYSLINQGKKEEAATHILNTGKQTNRRTAVSNLFSKGIYLPPAYYENPSYYKAIKPAEYKNLKNPVK